MIEFGLIAVNLYLTWLRSTIGLHTKWTRTHARTNTLFESNRIECLRFGCHMKEHHTHTIARASQPTRIGWAKLVIYLSVKCVRFSFDANSNSSSKLNAPGQTIFFRFVFDYPMFLAIIQRLQMELVIVMCASRCCIIVSAIFFLLMIQHVGFFTVFFLLQSTESILTISFTLKITFMRCTR